jgi:hypothetical protein
MTSGKVNEMTAKQCQAITQNGAPCQAYAGADSDYCFHHDPARVAERRQARSKGGRARHGRQVGPVGQAEPLALDSMTDVAALLRQTINDTLRLENSLQRARTLGYLAGLFLKALDMAILEQRVLALERALELREDSP